MPFPKRIPWLIGLVAATILPLGEHDSSPGGRHRSADPERETAGPYPSDWFGLQRAFPGTEIPQEKFRAAVEQAFVDRVSDGFVVQATPQWIQAGPYNIGGRVTALAAAPGGSTVYLGAANGGVFKSVDSGVHWMPIFDPIGVFSIGALALDPSDPNVLYVGTGEANSAVDTYDGAGVYRTADGGATWQALGLELTARIGAVEVDPLDPNRIMVAAMGRQFSTGPDRGLYRSEDGGASWQKTLFVNDSTGVADVVINPAHPETVYCATWERVRRPTYRRAFGPGCGIWRSADHGSTWTRLSGGLPSPSDSVGRIGLAIAPSRPSTIYAQIVTGVNLGYVGYGFYRSLDAGETWFRRDAGSTYSGNFGGFGWYFGETVVDPTNPDRVFSLGLNLLRSINGGNMFSIITGSNNHPDQHALWMDPTNTSRIYLGNDGGFFRTTNGAGTWNKSVDLPITQFYAGTIDPSNPARLLGGTQDNFTLLTTGSPTAWNSILGGDGFQCLVDPTNPSVIFAEWQNCCDKAGPQRSPDSGVTWMGPTGFNSGDRYNWNSPIAMDPSNHNILLVGSQRVYRSTDNGVSYTPISGDLTTNPPALLPYGTLTTLAISPADPAVYYAGSDDGKVWRSLNSGSSWTDISAGLPRRWVTRVTPDPLDASVVYVTLSGFGMDEHLAHVYRSGSQGNAWTSISSNLPDVPANDLVVDPSDTRFLYLATDVGVYATVNRGAGWYPLGEGMPIQTVFDLTLHAASRTLVAATHGRSQWKLELPAPTAVADGVPPPRLSVVSAAPNPSRGDLRVELEMSRPSAVEVTIYDAAGRRVRTVLRERIEAGRRAIVWNGTDEQGRTTGPGVFFVRASAEGAAAMRRVIRVR